MKIATSPDFLESVANDPRVFPYISWAGVDRADFSPYWDQCIGLEFDTGGWLLIRRAPRVYEVHTMFLPKSRDVIGKARQVLDYLFPSVADELFTFVPVDLPHAKRLALRMGFEYEGTERGAWMRDSGPVDVECFWLTKEQHMERAKCQQQSPQ